MALRVTFDCVDPHAQARFWAAALDYDVEDHEENIAGVVAAGHVPADSEDIVTIDGRRAWRDDAGAHSRDSADRLLFQRVPGEKTAKNRIHLDLHVAAAAAKIEQLFAFVPRSCGTVDSAPRRGSRSGTPRATSSA